MSRPVTVVVGTGTLDSRPVRELVTSRAAAGHDIVVVIPASPLSIEQSAFMAREGVSGWLNEAPEVSAARWQLARVLGGWAALGITATGEIGHHDVLRAAAATIARHGADEVVIADSARSGWRRRGVVTRARRRLGISVSTVGPALA